MSRLISVFFFCIVANATIVAMPAYPRKIPIRVEGKDIYICLFGDEHSKRAETLDGYTIIQKDNVWYYAEKSEDGRLRASAHKLSASHNAEQSSFLKGLPLHLKADKRATPPRLLSRLITCERTRAAEGDRRILIILMEFSDMPFVRSKKDFYSLFNQPNYQEDNASGSVYDFYNDVSYGKLQLSCDIIGPFVSKNKRSYYGRNDRDGDDENPVELFEEAMENAVEHVNLSNYDADGDGYVDNIHIVFAGHGEEAGASSDAIWSHEISFREGFSFQGMLVDRYSCAPELRGNNGSGISRIGPHCHEIGHALGAMDYYDTNYESNGYFAGTGQWDIMASGSWNEDGVAPADFNPYVKMVDFGWVDISELPEGNITIGPSSESENNYYKLTNTSDDYYLIENRSSGKWDVGLPGSGLLIYHVHPNVASSGNEINATYPQKCYPVCASSNYQKPSSSPSSYGDVNSPGCPFPGTTGKTAFSSNTTPAAFAWSGATSHITLRNIREEDDGSISLYNQSMSSDAVDGLYLFQENFEENPIFSVSSEGYSEWNHYTFSEGKIQKGTVLPHSGNGYLRFIPGKMTNTKQESTVVMETKKAKESHEAILSLYYYGKSFRPEEDMLGIQFCCDDQEWSDTIWMRSNRTDWNNFMQELPSAKSYQLRFFSKAGYGQSVYLDDIEVMQLTPASLIRNNLIEPKKEKLVYDLLGRKWNSRRKGLNFIRESDGTVKKIFVK